MYEGKKPFYVITTLAGAIIILGVFLVYLTLDDNNSALTGSTVIDTVDESGGVLEEELGEVKEKSGGSIRKLFDGGDFVDFNIGDEIVVGEYLIEVVNVKIVDKIGTYLSVEDFRGDVAENKFYVVQIYVTNNGGKEGYISDELFKLYDGEYEYLVDNEGTKYLFENGLYYPVLRKGLKRGMKAAFDVVEGDYSLLVYGDGKIYRVKI